MTEHIIVISDGLWLDLEAIGYDGLFKVCDGVGGNTLVDIDEVPALIEVLYTILGTYGTSEMKGEVKME